MDFLRERRIGEYDRQKKIRCDDNAVVARTGVMRRAEATDSGIYIGAGQNCCHFFSHSLRDKTL